MKRSYITSAGAFLVGVLFTLWVTSSHPARTTQAEEKPDKPAADDSLDAMESDVAQLKDKASDQAHAMVSVAYHFNNLWFAGEAENWPLAEFYWSETRSHLRWAVRIIPVRKDNAGQEIKLREILEAVENSPPKQLSEAIEAKNHEKFVAAYRFTLEGCNACHKASDKPYLLPQIPEQPTEPAMNFDPHATWPRCQCCFKWSKSHRNAPPTEPSGRELDIEPLVGQRDSEIPLLELS